MANKYWFKPKYFGYGFFPISWEGWLSTIVLISVLLISVYTNNFFSSEIEDKDGLRFLLDMILTTGLFTSLYKDKVKGGLRWNWGNSTE